MTEWWNIVENQKTDWMVENGGNWLNGGKWWKLTECWKMVETDWILVFLQFHYFWQQDSYKHSPLRIYFPVYRFCQTLRVSFQNNKISQCHTIGNHWIWSHHNSVLNSLLDHMFINRKFINKLELVRNIWHMRRFQFLSCSVILFVTDLFHVINGSFIFGRWSCIVDCSWKVVFTQFFNLIHNIGGSS